MITESDVRKAISQSIQGFDVESLGLDQNFYEAGMDSLDHMTILLKLQETYNLVVPDDALDQVANIRGILEFQPPIRRNAST
jgi:acyl carrier protein